MAEKIHELEESLTKQHNENMGEMSNLMNSAVVEAEDIIKSEASKLIEQNVSLDMIQLHLLGQILHVE